ncbi:MAG: phage holin family protein [Myxococcota bacterium]|jgi:putative membrane protein
MSKFVAHWFSISVALALAAWLLPGVHVDSLVSLALGSLAVGLVNALVRPVLTVLTLPLTVLTLGLFYLVVNAMAFGLAAAFVGGFRVDGLGAAVLGALVTSVASGVVEAVVRDRPRRD